MSTTTFIAPPARRWFADVVWGALVVALANLVDIALLVVPAPGPALRAAHVLFDVAECLGLGLLGGALAAVGALGRKPSRWRWGLVYAILATGVAWWFVGGQFDRLAHRPAREEWVVPIRWALLIGVGVGMPLVHGLAARLSSRRLLGLVLPLLALSGMVANHLLLRDDYEGSHAIASWATALGIGPWIARLVARRMPRAEPRLLAGLALAGVLGLVVPPGNAVRLELFRQPGMAAPWLLSDVLWRLPVSEAGRSAGTAMASRDPGPAAPRSPLVENPVVVLFTIDAARADAFEGEDARRELPTLTELKRGGADFVTAVAPGSQTAVSLSTLFSGRYLSQLLWEHYGQGRNWFPFPARDPSPRLAGLLSRAGVETVSFCALRFLAGSYGVLRGFAEEQVFAEDRYHAALEDLWRPLIDRVERAGSAPLFLYVHAMEAHAPYDRGPRRTGTERERYLSELALVDRKLGELRSLLARRFPGRAYLLVGSDHGEAFGEHGTTRHSKTLYEELVHVPLIIEGPGVVPRRIEERVGLVDLAPTILEIFGLPPADGMIGASLVPAMQGRAVASSRPLIAEGRYRRALWRGRHKVIEDQRRKTVELYDLSADPQELVNLADDEPAVLRELLGELHGFFAVHELRTNPLTGAAYRAPLVL